MDDRLNALSKEIFKKDFTEIGVDEPSKVVNQYPYYAPAHFLNLLRSGKGSETYNAQYQHAILYYHDPLSFEQFLNLQNEVVFHETEDVRETTVQEPVIEQETIIDQESSVEESITAPEPAITYETIIDQQEPVIEYDPFIEQEPVVDQETAIDLEPVADQESTIQHESVIEHEQPVMFREPVAEQKLITAHRTVIEQGLLTEQEDVKNEDAATEIIEAQETQKIVEPVIAESTSSLTKQFIISSDGTEEVVKDEMIFEPYHTVDYFASQGIKISSDAIPQDKFSKQVRSFTDWLRTMKKLPLSEPYKNVVTATERGVENLAEHSVEDAEVVTESMAEVWLKQGNIEKATEVYNKLSLQNPSKSTYFAAKISNLKHSI